MYTIHEVLRGSVSKVGNNMRDQGDRQTLNNLVRNS